MRKTKRPVIAGAELWRIKKRRGAACVHSEQIGFAEKGGAASKEENEATLIRNGQLKSARLSPELDVCAACAGRQLA